MMDNDFAAEYSAAFNAGDDAEMADAVQQEAAPAVAEPAAAQEVSAEESAGTLDPDAEPALSAEETQQEKSWRGRLEKMERELKAREAALAEREMSRPTMDADGGEAAAAQEDGAGESLGEAPGDSAAASSFMERIRARANEMMSGPDFETALADASETYGDDFLALAAAMGGMMYGPMAQKTTADFDGKLSGLANQVQGHFRDMHVGRIMDDHPDAPDLVDSPEFKAWVEGKPEAERAKAQEVIERGRARQVARLLSEYKDSLKAGGDEFDDTAMGVRSSSPVSIPGRPAMDEQTEYSRAFRNRRA